MKILKWIKKIAFGLIGLIVLALVVGLIYEQTLRSNAEKEYKHTGEFVDVGGHKLHYLKKGTGGPTVVFESGLDMAGHLPWFKVQNSVAEFTSTISYDRAGILWSERGEKPKSIKAMGEDLKMLLEKSGAEKPYILVGHSLAGLTLKQYIKDNTIDIAAVVFVDASNPYILDRMSDDLKALNPKAPPGWILSLMKATGVYRIMFSGGYTNNESDMINVLSSKFMYKGFDGFFEEVNSIESLAEEAKEISAFGDVSLKVISAGDERRANFVEDEFLRGEMLILGMELQKELLELSTNSEQILATESGHYVQLDEPKLVIETIRKLISDYHNISN